MAAKNGKPDAVLGELYPFEDKSIHLDDGTCMHYVEAGHQGLRKPTFLLLHGSPTWSFLYRDFIEPLAKIGRVIAVDHVGFGRSDHPSDPNYYSLERHIRNLEEFAEKTKLKRVIPVVQDWGGPIGLGYATRHPDNLVGLVIMNTWAFTKRIRLKLPPILRLLRTRGVGEFLIGRRNLYVEKFIPKFTDTDLPAAVMQGYRHPFPTPQSRVGVTAFVRMVPDKPGHKDWATMEAIDESLSKIQVPTRILWAENDPAFSKRNAWAFRDAIPKAETPRFFADAGHFLQEDIPNELVAEIAAFAKGL